MVPVGTYENAYMIQEQEMIVERACERGCGRCWARPLLPSDPHCQVRGAAGCVGGPLHPAALIPSTLYSFLSFLNSLQCKNTSKVKEASSQK